jgi:serine/threonine protein kinase
MTHKLPVNSAGRDDNTNYPDHFYFQREGLSSETSIRGKTKSGGWFVNPVFRFGLVDPSERGDFGGMLMCCLNLARAVDAFHRNGAVHCDISPQNILLDPVAGESMLVGTEHAYDAKIDKPDIWGTPGFIAPEIVATCNNPQESQVLPNLETDRHSLAVLIYLLLLCRHPLAGAAVWDEDDQKRDDNLTYGEKALFVEHPTDQTNRYDWKYAAADWIGNAVSPVSRARKEAELPLLRPWRDLDALPYTKLGPHLSALIERAFVDGLHNPSVRPTAAEWANALEKTIPLNLSVPN